MSTDAKHQTGAPDADPVLTVPILQEQLEVHTRTVEHGGVRIHKHVHQVPQQVDATLLHDTLRVTHVPIDRIVPLEQIPPTRQDGDTLIIPVLEEVLIVEKRVRIKEEIHIQRRQEVRHHTETVQLRAETADIEHFSTRSEPTINSADTPGDA